VAFKNSTSNTAAFCEAFFALRDQVRTFGFTSTGLGMALVRHSGLDGSMGAGALLGREHPQFFEALWAGEVERAELLLKRDVALMRAFYKPTLTAVFGSAQAVCKEALNQMGLPGGYPRPPILPLQDEEKQYVREVLMSLGKLPRVRADEWREHMPVEG
jgi:4-hydroxy-tetrahydrodipicolinate synthase